MSATNAPVVPDADDKDWTWTLTRVCPECGYDPATVAGSEIPERLTGAAARWQRVLQRADVGIRPAPAVWSPLEYAAHVRDVFEIFAGRAQLMLDQDGPSFANWDQDATALEKQYWTSDPAAVAQEVDTHAADAAKVFAGVSGGAWGRKGFRSNGSEFTVHTLGVYFLHDLMHHLHDVRG